MQEAPDALLCSCQNLHTCWRILSRRRRIWGVTTSREREGRSGRRGWYRSMNEDACYIAYAASIFIHQPRLRFSRRRRFRCGFPRHRNARCTVTNRGCRSREKFSCRRNAAIRHRDSVKSNVENAFTRDRVYSSLGFAPLPDLVVGKWLGFA